MSMDTAIKALDIILNDVEAAKLSPPGTAIAMVDARLFVYNEVVALMNQVYGTAWIGCKSTSVAC